MPRLMGSGKGGKSLVGAAAVTLLEGEVDDAVGPFGLLAALGDQQDVVDTPADRGEIVDDEIAGHAFACGQPDANVIRHSATVMGQQDPAVRIGPLQNRRTASSPDPANPTSCAGTKSRLLLRRNSPLTIRPLKSSSLRNRIMLFRSGRASSEEPLPNSCGIVLPFDFLARLRRIVRGCRQIGVDFRPMVQVVVHHRFRPTRSGV